MPLVICVSSKDFGDFSADDLTPGRTYKVVTPADNHGMIRIIDDSGEESLYPAPFFETVNGEPEVKQD